MFLTWLTSSVIAAEVVLYLIFVAVDRGRSRPVACGWFYFALCIGLFAMAGTSMLAYLDTLHKIRALDVIAARFQAATDLMRNLREMEIGQRGYLLTGRVSYLEPYLDARQHSTSSCEALRSAYATSDERDKAENLCRLGRLKVEEMSAIVELKRSGKPYEALEKIQSDTGKNLMDLARATGDDLIKRQLAAYQKLKGELHDVARGRIVMAALVLVGSVMQMLLGVIFGWPAQRAPREPSYPPPNQPVMQ